MAETPPISPAATSAGSPSGQASKRPSSRARSAKDTDGGSGGRVPGLRQIKITNWAGTFSCEPAVVFHPASEDEIVDVIRQARYHRQPVKVLGFANSPSDIGFTSGFLMQLDRYNHIVRIDQAQKTICAEAGLRLRDLHAVAAQYGLAMQNLGAISEQALGGLISTGTHGSGETFGIIATTVVALRLITADGQAHDCSASQNVELFQAARCGLGALGVISTVTFQLEPAFRLRERRLTMPLDRLLGDLPVLRHSSEHFKFLWYPYTEEAVLVSLDRTTMDVDRPAPNWFEDQLISHRLLESLLWLASFRPSWIPAINRFYFNRYMKDQKALRVDDSVNVFNFDCLFKQHVTEWAIPSEHAPAALRQLKAFIDETQFPAHFPIEVRFVAADDIWLSPAYGRPTCFIGIIMYRPFGRDFDRKVFWDKYESIMRSYGGRPHWGKSHSLTAEELRQAYPRFDDFMRIRAQCDPEGLFVNDYLHRHLFPAGTLRPTIGVAGDNKPSARLPSRL